MSAENRRPKNVNADWAHDTTSWESVQIQVLQDIRDALITSNELAKDRNSIERQKLRVELRIDRRLALVNGLKLTRGKKS